MVDCVGSEWERELHLDCEELNVGPYGDALEEGAHSIWNSDTVHIRHEGGDLIERPEREREQHRVKEKTARVTDQPDPLSRVDSEGCAERASRPAHSC